MNMALDNIVKQAIALTTIEILKQRFDSFPSDLAANRNAPFHEAFLSAFTDKLAGLNTNASQLINLSSWLQGLNTTLGQKFFETVAKALCQGEKKEWTSKRDGNLKISLLQREAISEIITRLSNSECLPNMPEEDNAISKAASNEKLVNALDFNADVFFEEKDRVVAIELKSVKPNSGELRGEKQKILEAKAALSKFYQGKQVFFYLGFPFDPTVDNSLSDPCSSDKHRFFSSIINIEKYFDPEEVLLASELWDMLSGSQGTMQEIISIINSIATPEFETDFRKLRTHDSIEDADLVSLLRNWFLFDELQIIENKEQIGSISMNDPKLFKVVNQCRFTADGSYNHNRYQYLKNALSADPNQA